MLCSTRRWILPAVLVGWLGLAGSASAVFPPPIKDDAKLFSAEALEKANKQVKEIYTFSKKDLVIETFAAVPEGKNVPDDPKKKEEFFASWAEARIKELGVNGAYVLICKSPTYLLVDMKHVTPQRSFTPADRARVLKAMIAAFREKKFDDGLKAAVDAVEAALKANLKS